MELSSEIPHSIVLGSSVKLANLNCGSLLFHKIDKIIKYSEISQYDAIGIQEIRAEGRRLLANTTLKGKWIWTEASETNDSGVALHISEQFYKSLKK